MQDFGALGPLPIHIEDFPDLVWRGIMIDTARHFQPIPVIQRTIRGLQIAKVYMLFINLITANKLKIFYLLFVKTIYIFFLKNLSHIQLNVLHLHLTDSESFPVQLNNYSRIT